MLMFAAIACSKEELGPSQNEGIIKDSEAAVQNAKSSVADFGLLAQAAGLKEIDGSGTGYVVEFWREGSFQVDLLSFDADRLIQLEVEQGASLQSIEIDVMAETIAWGNEQVSFDDLESSRISESQDAMVRIAALVTVYHLINPQGSDTFPDGGGNDIFPDGTVGANCFWCNEESFSPCRFYYKTKTVKKYRFWGLYDTVTSEVPC